MKANRDLRRNASVRSVALAIAIVMLGACVGRDDEECWSGVDTLYAANIAVSRIDPGGHLNFPHLWPGQTPPPDRDGTRGC